MKRSAKKLFARSNKIIKLIQSIILLCQKKANNTYVRNICQMVVYEFRSLQVVGRAEITHARCIVRGILSRGIEVYWFWRVPVQSVCFKSEIARGGDWCRRWPILKLCFGFAVNPVLNCNCSFLFINGVSPRTFWPRFPEFGHVLLRPEDREERRNILRFYFY